MPHGFHGLWFKGRLVGNSREGGQPGQGYPGSSLPQGNLRLAVSIGQMVAALIKSLFSMLLYPHHFRPRGALVSSPGSYLRVSLYLTHFVKVFLLIHFRLLNSSGPSVSFFEPCYLFGPL